MVEVDSHPNVDPVGEDHLPLVVVRGEDRLVAQHLGQFVEDEGEQLSLQERVGGSGVGQALPDRR